MFVEIMFLSKRRRLLHWAISIGIIFVVFRARFVREILQHIVVSKTDSRNEKYQINYTWKNLRELKHLSLQHMSKAIVMAYARGGSTLFTDVFNIQTNDTLLWYEPLHGFHSFYSGMSHASKDSVILFNQDLTRKNLDPAKREAMTDYFTQLMNCDLEKLPIELFAMHIFIRKSTPLKEFARCTVRHNALGTLKTCLSFLEDYCHFQEYMGVNSERLHVGSLSSLVKCKDILNTMRRWKPDVINDSSTMELLRRYIVQHNAVELKNEIENSCPEFSSNSAQQKITRFKNLGVQNLTNECDLLEFKFYKFIEHYDCLMNLTRAISGCRGLLQEPCDRRKLTVAEVQRVFLSDLEPLIIRMPDIHIVHYVRDPRATSVSRAEKRYHTFKNEPSWTIVDEAGLLCERMRFDTEQKKRLQQIYPDSIITIRYEDLVLEPLKTVTKLYKYLRRPLPVRIKAWIKSRLSGKKDNGPYGVQRIDGRKHLTDWISIATKNDTVLMNELCKDVLMQYNYEL